MKQREGKKKPTQNLEDGNDPGRRSGGTKPPRPAVCRTAAELIEIISLCGGDGNATQAKTKGGLQREEEMEG